MVVGEVVVAPHLWPVLHLRLLHLGVVLVVLRRLMQLPFFYNGICGIARRVLSGKFWGNLGIGYRQLELPLRPWIRRWVLVWYYLLNPGRLVVQLA